MKRYLIASLTFAVMLIGCTAKFPESYSHINGSLPKIPLKTDGENIYFFHFGWTEENDTWEFIYSGEKSSFPNHLTDSLFYIKNKNLGKYLAGGGEEPTLINFDHDKLIWLKWRVIQSGNLKPFRDYENQKTLGIPVFIQSDIDGKYLRAFENSKFKNFYDAMLQIDPEKKQTEYTQLYLSK